MTQAFQGLTKYRSHNGNYQAERITFNQLHLLDSGGGEEQKPSHSSMGTVTYQRACVNTVVMFLP